jgi:hypothetical protein
MGHGMRIMKTDLAGISGAQVDLLFKKNIISTNIFNFIFNKSEG